MSRFTWLQIETTAGKSRSCDLPSVDTSASCQGQRDSACDQAAPRNIRLPLLHGRKPDIAFNDGVASMWAFLERILDPSMLSPHGICLLWEPELIWLHVTADALIAVAYFSIPVALSILVSKRPDVD